MGTSSLTRVCRGCALEKPLSAFLQLTGAHGTNYATLCSTCRATGQKVVKTSASEDETAPSGVGGSGIRGKEKLVFDARHTEEVIALNRFHLEKDKELLEEENKKKELLTEQAAQEELLHTIEEKRRDPDARNKKTAPPIRANENVSTTDKTQRILHAARASFADQVKVAEGAEEKRHTDSHHIVADTERKNTSTDFNTLIEAIAPGKIEYQGEGIKHLMNWLGSDSKLVKAIRGLPSKTATSEVAGQKITETITDGPDRHPTSTRSK